MPNVGILGFAHGHVNKYCQRWNDDPSMGVRVVAGWDHDSDRAAKAAEQHGVELAESPGAVVERDDVEAVVVAAETSMHADLAETAADAGVGTILQKPMALTLDEADRIVDAADSAGVPFTMAWQMRVDPMNLKMKELIESGVLGRVFMVRRRHGLSMHKNPSFFGSWHVKPELNRDIFADDASHAADFVLWLLGMPNTVTAELGSLSDPRMPNDHAIAIYRYADGRFAEVVNSFACVAGENTTEIVGEDGVVIQNCGDGPSTNIPRPPGAIGLKWFLHETGEWTISDLPIPNSQGDRIAGLARPLAEFLAGDRPPIATAREGRDALRLILACYESAEQGRRVELV
ncbi:MAG: Gfo/Idh/MocA family oxidoreductase [Planctomycetota bacterium]